MKAFLLRFFTWWNSQTFGTQLWTALYGELQKLAVQAWLTGADAAAFAEIAGKADMLEVSPGQIGKQGRGS